MVLLNHVANQSVCQTLQTSKYLIFFTFQISNKVQFPGEWEALIFLQTAGPLDGSDKNKMSKI